MMMDEDTIRKIVNEELKKLGMAETEVEDDASDCKSGYGAIFDKIYAEINELKIILNPICIVLDDGQLNPGDVTDLEADLEDIWTRLDRLRRSIKL